MLGEVDDLGKAGLQEKHNTCVKGCIRGCWKEGKEIPSFDPENCELCLKCVHNCPERAIVFSKAMVDRPRLNRKFYSGLKEGLLSA